MRVRLLLVLVVVFAFAGLFGWLTKSMLDALGPKRPVQEAIERVPHPRVKKAAAIVEATQPRPATAPTPTAAGSTSAITSDQLADFSANESPRHLVSETPPRSGATPSAFTPIISIWSRAEEHVSILGHVRLAADLDDRGV